MIGGTLCVVSFLTRLGIVSRYKSSFACPVAMPDLGVYDPMASFSVFAASLSLLRIAGIPVIFLGIWLVLR